MLDYQRSNARIVFFDPHHRGRSSCTCLWRRSWGLGWGSNGSRWPSCLSRRRWNLVPLGFLPHSLWFPCTASLRWSVCWHAGPTSKDNKNSWERRITALKCDEISRKTLRKGTLFCIFITFCIKYVKCFIAASLVLLCSCRPCSPHGHSCYLRICCVLDYVLQVKYSSSISLNITALIRYIGVILNVINLPIAHKLALWPFYWTHILGGLSIIGSTAKPRA